MTTQAWVKQVLVGGVPGVPTTFGMPWSALLGEHPAVAKGCLRLVAGPRKCIIQLLHWAATPSPPWWSSATKQGRGSGLIREARHQARQVLLMVLTGRLRPQTARQERLASAVRCCARVLVLCCNHEPVRCSKATAGCRTFWLATSPLRTTRMPRPPPPKAAFRMIGKPAPSANACASSAVDIAVSVPGTTGTPISVASALAVVLLPIA